MQVHSKYLPNILISLLGVVYLGLTASASANDWAASVTPISLQVSLCWEGDQIQTQNIEALREFRRRFDSIKLEHFIDPAYFTKKGADAAGVRAKMLALMETGDDIGMQLHPWKSLVEAAGLKFKRAPSIWGNVLTDADCENDCGQEIPLTTYKKEEIDALFETGLKIFADNSLGKPTAFMAGAWLASPMVLDSAVAHGFRQDFSGIPLHLVHAGLERYPFFSYLTELWSGVNPYAKPFTIPTLSGSITEIVETGGAVDYVTSGEIAELFRAYAALQKSRPADALVMHLVLHQENAAEYVPRLASILTAIYTLSQDLGAPIRPVTLPWHSDEQLYSRDPMDTGKQSHLAH